MRREKGSENGFVIPQRWKPAGTAGYPTQLAFTSSRAQLCGDMANCAACVALSISMSMWGNDTQHGYPRDAVWFRALTGGLNNRGTTVDNEPPKVGRPAVAASSQGNSLGYLYV